MIETQVNGFAARAAAWSTRHRWAAVLGWLTLVCAATVLSGLLGVREATDADRGHGESGRADRIVAAAEFPHRSGERVLVTGGGRTVDDPGFAATVRATVRALRATGVAVKVSEPAYSADRRAALVGFELADPAQVGTTLDAVAAVQRAHPGFVVAEAGEASAEEAIDAELDRSLARLSLLSLPVTLGILLVAFGALVAALLPVALAVTAVAAAVGLVAATSRLAPSVDTTTHVMLLVGLAVGVDYCLFYLRREREERANGASAERALLVAAQTSGRSVWISGLTVIVAMSGMLLTGDVTFVSFGVGTALVVATAVLGSLTVLPALLSLLGDRVELGRVGLGRVGLGRVGLGRVGLGRARRRARPGAGGRLWQRLLGGVLRQPLLSALLAVVALGALAAPALRMQLRPESVDDFAGSVPVVRTVRQIRSLFPGGDEPARVVVRSADVTAPPVAAALDRFRAVALATTALHDPIAVTVNPDRTVAVVSVGLSGDGTDAASDAALATLREHVAPAVFGGLPATTVAVTGETAEQHDFNADLADRLPWVFGFVLGLTFLLTLLSFRSVVIAATTILLNLLSVAAAYGLLVLVFQDGRGERLLGFESNGGLVDWLPLLLFVILFGLSMDYHVFVLSRIREGHDRGLDTRRAVADGIAGSAGVITSAAAVMVAVFALFATMPLISMKEVGVGLSAAVLIDATVVRAVLLPAVMTLLGRANWWLPRWLGWLPAFSPEPRALQIGRELTTLPRRLSKHGL